MSELRERGVERLTAAHRSGDAAPLRDQEAVADAPALSGEVAPSPEGSIDLEAVAAVFWTFRGRHQGAEDPEAAQNAGVGVAAFGFLCPRLPEEAGLPESLKENFDPADPSHEARFAHLVCSVHADVAVNGAPQERAAALDRALAWSDAALDSVHADDHVGFVELAIYAHDLWMSRFQTKADPDGLVAAARYGREVCTRLAVEPRGRRRAGRGPCRVRRTSAAGGPLLASAPGPAPLTPEEAALHDGAAVTRTDREVLAARMEFHNALQNYLFGHEPAQLERARRIAHRLREITRAGATDGEDPPWYDLMGDAYVDLVETVGPGGPRPDLDDTVVEQCRRTFETCPAGHPMRSMVTMTLARVLMQRAATLRTSEPERSQALLAEAQGLEGVLREARPDGSPIDMAGMISPVVDLIGRDRLPEVSTTDAPAPARRPEVSGTDGAPEPAPADSGPFGPFSAVFDHLRSRLAGHAAPEGWDNPALPVWMRAHGEIAAAADALGRREPRTDLALAHLEAAVEAMAGITDRGSDQTSAEHPHAAGLRGLPAAADRRGVQGARGRRPRRRPQPRQALLPRPRHHPAVGHRPAP
ncbi:hypothetical protein ACF1BU_34565 [Streptomyces sp. NPDC014724]|uniref:hypothetical protein n=1 Tax=unclassified Streptomyces TaxID=2593676 RepID=UPI0036F7322D